VTKTPDVVHTQRLRLRRPVFADADAIFNHFASDPEVTRYMSWPTHVSIADTQAFLKFAIENWQQHSMGTLLIESNGMVIGSTGIHLGQADVAAYSAETGYVFARHACGKGYATEVLQAMVMLAAQVGLKQLTAGCHPDNVASQRVLHKCGFSVEAGPRASKLFPNTTPALVITPQFQKRIS
jgi:ribosomal-protein-alanine N-acetyltransferase